ncbi:MAG TPA: DegV family protein [Thermoleophilia bacterium]|nr:DegV family protein [Thermoleophilia bacterium]
MTVLTLENTAIVADSTCDPPPGYFDQPGLVMVPLKVHFGDETYRDQVDLAPAEFFAKLAESAVLPTTSQPTVGEFTEVYARLSREYEHVFAFHLSSLMSGTYQASATAAAPYPNIEVYDTRLVSATVTLLIDRLRTRLAGGVTLDEAHAYIDHFLANGAMLFQVATLEYLRRGGRIGRAQSMVGDVLGIRPVITVDGGELTPYAKVRGERRALQAMGDFLTERSAPDDAVKLATWSTNADDKLPALEHVLLTARPRAEIVLHGQAGAVVGTHGGPGIFAFAMIVE